MSLYKGVVHLSVTPRVRELEKAKGAQARQVTVHFPPKTELGISKVTPASVTLYKITIDPVTKKGSVTKADLVGTFRQVDTHGVWASNQPSELTEAHKALFDSVMTVEKGDKTGTPFYAIYERLAVTAVEAMADLDVNLD
jgi:hypothetical protein